MATILIAYLIKKRKKRKQAQKENDAARYAELQRETSERISRTNTNDLMKGDAAAEDEVDEGDLLGGGEKADADLLGGGEKAGGLRGDGLRGEGLGTGEVVSAGLYGGVERGAGRGGGTPAVVA